MPVPLPRRPGLPGCVLYIARLVNLDLAGLQMRGILEAGVCYIHSTRGTDDALFLGTYLGIY